MLLMHYNACQLIFLLLLHSLPWVLVKCTCLLGFSSLWHQSIIYSYFIGWNDVLCPQFLSWNYLTIWHLIWCNNWQLLQKVHSDNRDFNVIRGKRRNQYVLRQKTQNQAVRRFLNPRGIFHMSAIHWCAYFKNIYKQLNV